MSESVSRRNYQLSHHSPPPTSSNTMDISKYRTKFPPKEHEEAVRMLLEGLDKQAPLSDLDTATDRPNSKTKTIAPLPDTRPGARYHDQHSMDSVVVAGADSAGSMLSCDQSDELLDVSSSSQGFGELSSPTVCTRRHHNHHHYDSSQRAPKLPKMQSKATSTTSDSMSSGTASLSALARNERHPDDQHDFGASFEAIPSRTIAVQCDLKVSSVKRDGGHFEPSDDLASMQASSISSTRYGFYKLSPETIERRRTLARSISSRNIAYQPATQIDTPTSMSELSSVASSSGGRNQEPEEFEVDLDTARPRETAARRNAPAPRRLASSPARGDHLRGVQSRPVRLDSLPRRPRTALSYVSASRLHNGRSPGSSSPDGLSEDSDRVGATLVRGRAVSHQTLSHPRTSATLNDPLSSSNSASETNGTGQVADNYRMPGAEQVLASKKEQQCVRNQFETIERKLANGQAGHEPRGDDTAASQRLKMVRNPANHLGLTKANELKRSATFNRLQQEQEQEISIKDEFENYHDDSLNQFAGSRSRILNEQLRQRQTPVRYGSMSLSRRPIIGRSCNNISGKPMNNKQPNFAPPTTGGPNGNSFAAAPLAAGAPLKRTDRTHSQQTLLTTGRWHQSGTCCEPSSPPTAHRPRRSSAHSMASGSASICRSTSMRHAPADDTIGFGYPLNGQQQQADVGSEDSESPLTRTWANPSSLRPKVTSQHKQVGKLHSNSTSRKSARSHSMRNVSSNELDDDARNEDNPAHVSSHQRSPMLAEKHYTLQATDNHFSNTYRTTRQGDGFRYNSDSASDELSSMENAQLFARAAPHHQPLDYDSQHRLNESGLPETNSISSTKQFHHTRVHPEAPSSYLGLAAPLDSRSALADKYATTGRQATITGRAMSQQSLTRPTMPLASGRRLRRAGGGSNSAGSDVGGSSVSLLSRLHGSRYENAHTRTPVVMYIPQITSKPNSMTDLSSGRAGVASRRSLRTRLGKSASQDRRKSLSRNGSDSESQSSMLRTLVKPRSSRLQTNGHYVSKRSSRMRRRNGNDSDEDENLDGVGQLATEIDSYKFRRRYSVPKDAKINWFAKLRQRVISSKS